MNWISGALLTLAITVAVSGCGVSGSLSSSGPQSSATFVVNGQTINVSLGQGTVTESFGGDRRLSYSGPSGCKGRYFTAGGADSGYSLTFRYSSRDAYLVYDATVYHFITGPRQHAGKLVWDHTFGSDHVEGTVDCPPPPPSGPLLPLNY